MSAAAAGDDDFVLTVRVGRRKDPTRRQVDIAMKCLLREVVAKVERDNQAVVAEALASLVDGVVERASRRERSPYSNYMSKALALAMIEDSGLEVEYCPPLVATTTHRVKDKAEAVKTKKKGVGVGVGGAASGGGGGGSFLRRLSRKAVAEEEVVYEWVAVPREVNEWAEWPPKQPDDEEEAAADGGEGEPNQTATATTNGDGGGSGGLTSLLQGKTPRGKTPRGLPPDLPSGGMIRPGGEVVGGGVEGDGGVLTQGTGGGGSGSGGGCIRPGGGVATRASVMGQPGGGGGGMKRRRTTRMPAKNAQPKKKKISAFVHVGGEKFSAPVRVPGWASPYASVVLLQSGVRGHVARSKVRRSVKSLKEPLYTIHFDLDSGHQYYTCTMTGRVTWDRPLLLFPKKHRTRQELILYLQTHHRRLAAKKKAGVKAIEVYVRIPLPEKQEDKNAKKKDKGGKKKGGKNKKNKIKNQAGESEAGGDGSEPTSPLSPTTPSSPLSSPTTPSLSRAASSSISRAASSSSSSSSMDAGSQQVDDDDGDSDEEEEEPSYFYYNTRTGRSFLEVPLLLYDQSPSELAVQGAAVKKNNARMALKAALEKTAAEAKAAQAATAAAKAAANATSTSDVAAEVAAVATDASSSDTAIAAASPKGGEEEGEATAATEGDGGGESESVIVAAAASVAEGSLEEGSSVATSAEGTAVTAAAAAAAAEVEGGGEDALLPATSDATSNNAATATAATATAGEGEGGGGEGGSGGAAAESGAEGVADTADSSSNAAEATASETGSKPKTKKKRLTKLEKAAVKEQKSIEAATCVQAHFRGIRSQKQTGRLMIVKRYYIREFDSNYKRHFYTHAKSGRTSWNKPRPLWGLSEAAFVLPLPLTQQLQASMAKLLCSVTSPLGKIGGGRSAKVKPEDGDDDGQQPELEVGLVVRKVLVVVEEEGPAVEEKPSATDGW